MPWRGPAQSGPELHKCRCVFGSLPRVVPAATSELDLVCKLCEACHASHMPELLRTLQIQSELNLFTLQNRARSALLTKFRLQMNSILQVHHPGKSGPIFTSELLRDSLNLCWGKH